MAKIKLRRDLAANWASVNPVLASGEPGYELDNGKLKFGDGSSAWSDLSYFEGGGTGLTIITPEEYEVQGVVTLAFTGAGVSVDRIDEVTTVTIPGGGADLGSFTIESNVLSVESGTDIYVETYETGGPGESKLVLKPQDDNNGENPTRVEGSYGVGIWANTTDGENTHKWLFGSDGWLSFPGTFPSGAIGYDSDTGTLQLARSLGVSLYTQAGAWVFGSNGSITFPDATVQTTAFTGSLDLLTESDEAPETGTFWFNTQEARMYVKFNGQWVDASPTVLAPPETNPTLASVTFNDNTTQTTAWTGSVSYNDLTDKPETPQFVGGGGADTWLTAD